MIEDYNVYLYNTKEWIKYFLQGALLGAAIGMLFYSSLIGSLALVPYGFLYVRNKKKILLQERKWKLNLQFRDGIASIAAALNAGYSIENAFSQAVKDLRLLYPPEAFIICEFEAIVRQINRNQPVEEALKNLAERSGVDDIQNFAEVFITAKRTGGDMIKIIRTTVNTIGDKLEVKREIITMVTAKQLECKIMNLIPFGIILYMQLCSPGYLNPLYYNLFGNLFMSILLVIYYLASQVSKKIVSIDV